MKERVLIRIGVLAWLFIAGGYGSGETSEFFVPTTPPIEVKIELLWGHFLQHEALLQRYMCVSYSTARRSEMDIHWVSPTPHRVKVNVDGTSRGNPGSAGCGCVIRSHEGVWLIGAARNMRICSAFQSELAAVCVGLKLAWEKGFRQIVFETDSTLVYSLITASEASPVQMNGLVVQCKQFLSRPWSVEVQHIYR